MKLENAEIMYAATRADWRRWLQDNHQICNGVWLLQYKKGTNTPFVNFSEAIEEALCFGWIDSMVRSVDHEKTMHFFSKRKAGSVWSKINKEKVAYLTEQGLMTDSGLAAVALAKQNGNWDKLNDVENLIIPPDLLDAFKLHSGSSAFFESLSTSVKKAILQWLLLAKKIDTRQRRIEEIASLAAKKMKPKQF
jgi:uncharacterized protein YdeI (YjbR/CyaY-like superfamily)